MTKNLKPENDTTENPSHGTPGKVWIRRIVYTVVGTLIGGIIGHFWCGISGSCPVTSNPAIASVAGGIFGLLWTLER